MLSSCPLLPYLCVALVAIEMVPSGASAAPVLIDYIGTGDNSTAQAATAADTISPTARIMRRYNETAGNKRKELMAAAAGS